MNRVLATAAFFATGALALSSVSFGHGGTYKGPGDLVPPGGHAPNPGTAGTPGHPRPLGPTTPSPSGPNGTPTTGGPGPSTRAPGGAGPSTGIDLGSSLEKWQFWWEFNRNPFLDLRRKIFGAGLSTGYYESIWTGRPEDAIDRLGPSRALVDEKIVPFALEAVRKGENREVVDSAMIALAKIGGNEAFLGAIAAHLRDPNVTLAETATVALGILADPAALPALKGLALDSADGRALAGRREVPHRMRAFAAYGLALLSDAVAEAPVDEEIAGILLGILRSDRAALHDLRVSAAIGLGLVDDPAGRIVPALASVFDDRDADPFVRAHAPVAIAKALARGNRASAEIARFTDRFVAALRERREDERVQESCALALGALVEPGDGRYDEVARLLEETMNESRREQVRAFAAIGLADAGGEKGAVALRRALARGKSSLRPWAGLALGVLSRWEEARGRAVPSRDQIVGEVTRAMRDEANPEFVGAYGLGLGLLGDRAASDEIVAKLGAIVDDDARGYLCVALGLLGDAPSRALLREQVRGAAHRPELLRQASVGLGLLSDPDAVPELLAILREANTLASQASVAQALGFIGDQRSIDPLVALARDESASDLARGFAVVALGMIADKEPLPWNTKISVGVNYRAFTGTLVGASFAPGVLDIL